MPVILHTNSGACTSVPCKSGPSLNPRNRPGSEHNDQEQLGMTRKVPPLACRTQTSLQGSCSSNIGIGSEIQGNTDGEQPGTIPVMAEGPMSSLGQGSAVNPREHTCQCWTAQAAVKHELHVPKAKLDSRRIPWDLGMHASVFTRQAQVMLLICNGSGSPCSVAVLTLVEYQERLGIPIQHRHL